MKDLLLWDGNSGNAYNIKSFIVKIEERVYAQRLNEAVNSFIWQRKGPPKAEVSVWYLALEKFKTTSYLAHLNIILENKAC